MADYKTTQGLSLKSGVQNPNPSQYGSMGQAERAFSAVSTLVSGLLAISASQLMGAPLKLIDGRTYKHYMAWTKESFAVLMTTITQWWAPTVVRVSGDESMKGQIFLMENGTLKCNFPHRIVLMANHQLYTDWLYLWWIAYTNKMHGRIYIVLKESLKKLPIIGWGMQFYNFIFLCRRWEQDKITLRQQLHHLKSPDDPMWLLLFPEGTNLSRATREKSAAWSQKSETPDMKHQLLPRSTGLRFCLQELRASTNWLYDCTIAYEGVPDGLYGQDVYTLKSSFVEGRPPKSVNMFWRRFRISEIPCDHEEAFNRWLLNRWREKDYLLEYFSKFGSFPAKSPLKAMAAVSGSQDPEHARSITASLRAGGEDEFLSIFAPITAAASVLQSADSTDPLAFEEIMKKIAESEQLDGAGKKILEKALIQATKRSPGARTAIEHKPQNAFPGQTRESSGSSGAYRVNHAGQSAYSKPGKTVSKPSGQKSPWALLSQTSANKGAELKPSAAIRRQLPLANMGTMVTRPLSTIAVQKAGLGARTMASRCVQPIHAPRTVPKTNARTTTTDLKSTSISPSFTVRAKARRDRLEPTSSTANAKHRSST